MSVKRYRYGVDTRRPMTASSAWLRRLATDNPFKAIEEFDRQIGISISLDSVRIMRWDRDEKYTDIAQRTEHLIKIHNPNYDDAKPVF